MSLDRRLWEIISHHSEFEADKTVEKIKQALLECVPEEKTFKWRECGDDCCGGYEEARRQEGYNKALAEIRRRIG